MIFYKSKFAYYKRLKFNLEVNNESVSLPPLPIIKSPLKSLKTGMYVFRSLLTVIYRHTHTNERYIYLR